MAFAQHKLTPQARLYLNKQKARIEQQARMARERGEMAEGQQQPKATLVVKVAHEGAAATFAQLRTMGATILSKIGQQAVISINADQLTAVETMKGIERIDAGHKPRYKTDITRRETGVSLLNGPGMTSPEATAYTGKGVTLCIIDAGFDYQHPAFKHPDGTSRIKALYMIGDERGRKFTINDPEAGIITFPGSVFDTPELIAQLTTDDEHETHGTHTAGIAAGSISPLGFGGMAPEADLVLITLCDEQVEKMEDLVDNEKEIIETAIAFANAYAQQNDQPTVLSFSAGSHFGPHDGTGSVPEAIEQASHSLIPVLSTGNEGAYPIYLNRKMTEASSFKTLLAMLEDENKKNAYVIKDNVVAYSATGDSIGISVSLIGINQLTGRTTTLWTSESVKATPSGPTENRTILSSDDATLSKYFDGQILLDACDNGKQMQLTATIEGDITGLRIFQLNVMGSANADIHMWDDLAGFNIYGLRGFATGNSTMSASDWVSTPRVIGVGAYCTNTTYRSYDGSEEEESDFTYKMNDYALFSSYGTMFNGVEQPTVSAPGVNIVSAWNHYSLGDDETVLDDMQWEGYPYSSETGTSMSCPVVSGIIALWLQARPDLTFSGVKKVLEETSRNDEFTLGSPARFGFGKIDAARGIDYLTNPDGIHEAEPAKDTGTTPYVYDLQGRRISHPAKGIYIWKNRLVKR